MDKMKSYIKLPKEDVDKAKEYLKERRESNYFFNSLLDNTKISEDTIAVIIAEYSIYCKDKDLFYTKSE